MFKKIFRYFTAKNKSEKNFKKSVKEQNQKIIYYLTQTDLDESTKQLIIYQLLIFNELTKNSKEHILSQSIEKTNKRVEEVNKQINYETILNNYNPITDKIQ